MCFLTYLRLAWYSSVPPLILLLIKKFVPLRMVRQHPVPYLLLAAHDAGARWIPSEFRFVFRQVGAFPSKL